MCVNMHMIKVHIYTCTLGRITLSIIERLSSFRGEMYCHYIVGASESVLYIEVSFIQSVLYQRFHCMCAIESGTSDLETIGP